MMPMNNPINIKGELRSCFNCNYETIMRQTRCPKCRGRTHTRTKIRVFGSLMFVAGALIAIVFAAAILLLATVITNPKYGVKLAASEESRFIVIFATLGAGAALGLALAAGGVWRIVFGRRSLFLFYAAVWLLFLVVVGTCVSFGAQSNYGRY
jgi:hypothetical protein